MTLFEADRVGVRSPCRQWAPAFGLAYFSTIWFNSQLWPSLLKLLKITKPLPSSLFISWSTSTIAKVCIRYTCFALLNNFITINFIILRIIICYIEQMRSIFNCIGFFLFLLIIIMTIMRAFLLYIFIRLLL